MRLRRGGEIKGGKFVMIVIDSKLMRIVVVVGVVRLR